MGHKSYENESDRAKLLISCPDRPGIVAAVADFLAGLGANITSSAQHSSDPEQGRFFMRLEFSLSGLQARREAIAADFTAHVAQPRGMDWRITYPSELPRVALFVSREDHCLVDLLWRHQRGELPCVIDLAVSNHPDLRDSVERFGIEFVHIPVTAETKPAAEAAALDRLDGRYDLVVLARYMQILSADFLAAVGVPVMNIHHSFLPAFAGADPYRRASERGVKIIGATAHYVTEELDAGPIIEQDVARVNHADDVQALTGLGRDIERLVLARAVRWHLEDRVLVDGNHTVVFP